MAKKQGFTFKQFHIKQDRCAMKVGTDGILLGAWANIDQANTLLDLGTGTGLIALMLAQRSSEHCHISAVELDPQAYLQAKDNIQQSPWANKIKIFQQDIIVFAQDCEHKFDVITANPPYFKQGIDCASKQRNLARYTLTQSHLDWLNAAEKLLNLTGEIHLILPFEEGKSLQKKCGLFCIRECKIITKAGKTPQRLLLSFSREERKCEESQLVIYDRNNQYSTEFKTLTQDFYLNF
ncbi:tRNA1(Val) (adenine(37)-N6)-methyltransferase [Histophilus somni]|uniref:tRNA1(Val) (adenine(37)-N6)-methyltransferase n=1 Tax=Histophilus somni TaxID=731 RepID=UPI00094AC312|nr:tRNA1(Val) (adenine(37)-N6)-methyltransferase [Histophilus somni]